MTILKVRDLRKSFTNHLRGGAVRQVLDGVSVSLEPGTCTVVTGSSGSGKSSLLRCIYGTYRPDSGSVSLATEEGRLELTTASDRELLQARRATMAMVTQFLSVTPRVRTLSLVADQGIDEASARELLDELGLARSLHELAPATFSGGERQIVNLAMALARPRPLLLLDEATASLDRRRREIVFSVLTDRKRRGSTILAIFHDPPAAPGLIDGIVEFQNGHLRERAS
jgi:alpha-D-ribose 1-methylphosphonate 5-triphosphate synthase subunit PhnL